MNIEQKFIKNLSREEWNRFYSFAYTLTPDVDSEGFLYTNCHQYVIFNDHAVIPLKKKACPSNAYLNKLIEAGYLAVDLSEYVLLLENKKQHQLPKSNKIFK